MVGRGRRWLSRGWRVLRVALLTVAVAVVTVLLVLTLAPARGALLGLALRLADRQLPGSIVVTDASWPDPGRLRLEGVVWLAEEPLPDAAYGDTLLHARSLELAVDLWALAGRDLRIERLRLDVARLDVPGITAALPAGTAAADTATVAPAPADGGVPWLRPGAAEDVPSVVCEEIEATLDRAVVAPAVVVSGAVVTGVLDASAAAAGAGLQLQGGARVAGGGDLPWLAEVPDLDLELRYGPGSGEIGIATCRVTVAAAGPAAWEPRWRAGGHAALELAGTARIDTSGVTTDIQGSLAAPAAALLGEDWPAELPPREYERIEIGFEVDAGASRAAGVQGKATLDLGGSSGWGRSRLTVVGVFDPERPEAADVRLDTLSVALPGLTLGAAGDLRGDAYTLVLRAEAASPVPLVALAGPELADLDLAAGIELECAGRGLPTAATAGAARVRLRGSGRAATADEAGWSVDASDLALDLVYDPARRQVALDTCRVRVASAGPRTWEERWWGGPPAELDVTGTVRLDTTSVSLDLQGSVLAPAVALAADRWPADLPAADYALLGSDFKVAATAGRPGGVTGSLALTVAGSPGWGTSRLSASGAYDPQRPEVTDLRVETLEVALPGLQLTGTGTYRGDHYEVDARAELAVPSPLLDLVGSEFDGVDLADAELTAGLDLTATGSGLDPDGRFELRVDGHAVDVEVRGLRLDAVRENDTAVVDLAAGLVARDGIVWADSLSATARHDATRDLPFGLEAAVHRGADHAGLAAAAGVDSVITLRLESLDLLAAGRQIGLVAPATVRLDTASRDLALDRFALAGDVGTLELEAARNGQDLSLLLATDLTLEEEFLQEVAPSSFWSESGGRDLLVRGDVQLSGTRDAPEFTGDLGATLRSGGAPDLGARLGLGLAAGDSSGLSADFALTSDDTVLFHGRALAPGRYAAAEGWLPRADGDLLLDVPEQTLPIRRFAPVIPAGLKAAGDVTFGARVQVPPAGPDADHPGEVAAVFHTGRMQITGPNRSRAELEVDCRLKGPALDPRLTGTITVPSAFIRLPEVPRSLHEVEGEALLWEAARADTTGLARDLPGAAGEDWGAVEVEKEAPPFLPELDLKVVLPGNVRINGYGIDVELAGEVEVTRGHDADGIPGPAIRGKVATVSGGVKVMSRAFEIQICEVLFTGRVPADPDLNMNMWADVSGSTIRVQVTGRASDPVITLSSNPDMNEADIMSYLIFGRPLNNLDTDQRGRMGQEEDPQQQLNENLAALAFAFGTRGVQRSVTGTLGVDTVEMGSDSGGGSTIAAGKYIGPRVLLKYHQSIEKSGTYFMTIEYFVSNVVRLVSTYGQGEEDSGLEVKLLKRY